MRTARQLVQALLTALFLFVPPNSVFAEKLKTSADFDSFPTPIKLYVLQLGVEGGIMDPADVTVGEGQTFDTLVSNSDLNLDGLPDHFAAACMFAPAEFDGAYQTNGYPCSSGMLMISRFGGFELVETFGMLAEAKAGKVPLVTIFQRNFNDCGDDDYMCYATYAVEEDGRYLKLSLKSICGASKCPR